MSDLRARVDNAIARVTASKAADEVLAEIAKTHVLVPRLTVAVDVDTIARLIWINLNDQRLTGTFGYQPPETKRPYLKAGIEIHAFLWHPQTGEQKEQVS